MSSNYVPDAVKLYRWGAGSSIIVVELGIRDIYLLHNGNFEPVSKIVSADVPITVHDLTPEELGPVIEFILKNT